jgi:heptosyltransferase-2
LRSLVVQTAFLGDVVLTTPLLRALARRGPVDVVTTSAGAALLRGHPAVTSIIPFDKRGADRGVSGLLRIARQAKSHDADDVAYLAQSSLRSATLAGLSRYRTRVGFRSSAGRLFCTELIDPPKTAHHAERLLALAGETRTSEPLRPSLHPASEDEDAVDSLLQSAGHEGGPLLAVAPGSVWGTKRWPHFGALLRVCADLGRPVIVGGADDRAIAAELVAATGGRAIDATGALGLLASAALIGRARVLVTNDSAPLHFASAMNTPTVAVFGPTVPAMGFGPLAVRAEIGEVEGLDCRPCHSHGPTRCPRGHWRCMRDLTASHVAELARRVATMPVA